MIEKKVNVSTEIEELLEAAMYKEVASQAFYTAGQKLTENPGAIALLKDLAGEEAKHIEWLKQLKEKGFKTGSYYPKKVPNMMISEYLKGGDSLEGAGLQDTLTFAIKREQQSLDFYANIMSLLKDRSAKRLCQRLTRAELGHKYKLETMYDDLFLAEN